MTALTLQTKLLEFGTDRAIIMSHLLENNWQDSVTITEDDAQDIIKQYNISMPPRSARAIDEFVMCCDDEEFDEDGDYCATVNLARVRQFIAGEIEDL